MNVAGLIDRLDDRINPIVVKELRQAVKSRLVVAMLLLFLALQAVLVIGYLVVRAQEAHSDVEWTAGLKIFQIIQTILLGTCMILVPAYTAIRVGSDRADNNVDLLFISTLRPSSIIAGKFFTAVVLALLITGACAPFMTFAYLLRGIDIPTILLILGIDMLAVLVATQFALFVGVLPGAKFLKFFLTFVAFVLLCSLFVFLLNVTEELLQGVGGRLFDEPVLFWSAFGTYGLFVLGLVGQMFCWSVALISPPSSNRALAGRVFMVTMWLAVGGLGYWLMTQLVTPGGMPPEVPVVMWATFSITQFGLLFLISINERDAWGPRVLRSVPRWRALRPVAFLFTSGAAGGMLLATLGVLATLGGAWAAHEWLLPVPPPGPGMPPRVREETYVVTKLWALGFLYAYCFGLSAVLVRAYLFQDRLRTTFTWLVVLLMVGLGTAVPSFVAYLLYFQEPGGRTDLIPWWLLPNPVGALWEIGHSPNSDEVREFEVLCCWFLGIWGAVVTVLAAPWLAGQVHRFRPFTPGSRRATRPAADEVVDGIPVPALDAGASGGA